MTLKKAIEILGLDKDCSFEGSSDDLEQAIQLGIEALKRIKDLRDSPWGNAIFRLPGETKE